MPSQTITKWWNDYAHTCLLTGMGTRLQWPRPRRDRDAGLTSRDETETRRWNFETRPRQDVCRSRDV